MNEETKLPDGLQLAVKLLAQIGDDDSDRAIAAVHAACDLAQRVADLEAERNKLAHEHHLVRADAQARVDAAVIRALSAEKERDELRHRADIAEQRCGVLIDADEPRTEQLRAACRERDELRARLAEIEGQAPVAVIGSGYQMLWAHTGTLLDAAQKHGIKVGSALYARPVPAIPDGWRLVPVEPTPEMLDAGRKRMSALGMYTTMIAAAPEHTA